MGVDRLRLARLETVQAHEQTLGAEAVDLGHGVGAECGALGQMLDQLSGRHGRFLAPDRWQSDGTERGDDRNAHRTRSSG
jgi:hypothetical protein